MFISLEHVTEQKDANCPFLLSVNDFKYSCIILVLYYINLLRFINLKLRYNFDTIILDCSWNSILLLDKLLKSKYAIPK